MYSVCADLTTYLIGKGKYEAFVHSSTWQGAGDAYEETEAHNRRSSFRIGGRDDYNQQVQF